MLMTLPTTLRHCSDWPADLVARPEHNRRFADTLQIRRVS